MVKVLTKGVDSLKTRIKNYSVVIAISFLVMSFGCEESETLDQALVLQFTHSVDDEPLVMNEMRYINKAGESYSVMTLRYYISSIYLEMPNGEQIFVDTCHYINVKDTSTTRLVLSSFPVNQFKKVSFTFGLDSTQNVSNTLSYLDNMEWPEPMGGGYHYMKLEGACKLADGTITNYKTHTGRLKTSDDLNDHSFVIELDIEDEEDSILLLNMNINEWYKDPHTYRFSEFGTAIMNNQEAQEMLMQNGKDVFTVL